jgi:hypothetical protein
MIGKKLQTPMPINRGMAIFRAAAVLAAMSAMPGCTERDVTSVENGLWQMFAGHPKPIVLNKADPPVYCYQSIGEPQCYAEPLEGEAAVPIQ